MRRDEVERCDPPPPFLLFIFPPKSASRLLLIIYCLARHAVNNVGLQRRDD